MTTPEVHEIKKGPDNPRFDPLRNESIERTCALQEARIDQWRKAHAHHKEMERLRRRYSSPAKVCPKR